jgi:hypothetical protein
MLEREHVLEYKTETTIENYVYFINSFFLVDSAKSAAETVNEILVEKMIRTFERQSK